METVILFVSSMTQGIGALVIAISVVRALIVYLRSLIIARARLVDIERVRFGLGRGLVLGLEFLIGADILRSILAPTWEDIAILAAIIAIRTVLSLSIQYELGHINVPETGQGRGSENA